MKKRVNRIMLAGTKSGDGKTTITLALLACLKDRGLRVNGFKCGPDYIDPMFHSRVLQIPTRNLDSFMMPADNVRKLLAQNAEDFDVTIIEGAMGYYDGIGLLAEGSSYQVAEVTDTPVILVINAKGQGQSVLAVLNGFMSYRAKSKIAGVIFNQMSDRLYGEVSRQCEKLGIRALGNFPYVKSASLESRHLGLITAAEIENFTEKIELLKETAKEHLDIDGVLDLLSQTPDIDYEAFSEEEVREHSGIKIAVARDMAFCFYYEDNLDYLRQKGCEIVEFSPINDKALPENIAGLILGGGYPELYAKSLSENVSMRSSIKNAIEEGLPVHGECGGYMYLQESLTTPAGVSYPMIGAIEGSCSFTQKLQHFGYVTMTALRDSVLCSTGEVIRGHEFHRSISTAKENGFEIVNKSEKYTGYVIKDNIAAGFPHIHYYSNLSFADKFVDSCRAFINKRKEA